MPNGSNKCIIALQTGQGQPKFAPYPEAALIGNPMNTLTRQGKKDQQTFIVHENEVQPISKFNGEYVKFYYHVYQSNTNRDDIFYNRVQFELAFVDQMARLIETRNMTANLYLKYNEALKATSNVALTAEAKLQGYTRISAIVKVVDYNGGILGPSKKK